jgi:hypothetical protein
MVERAAQRLVEALAERGRILGPHRRKRRFRSRGRGRGDEVAEPAETGEAAAPSISGTPASR